MSNTSQLTDYTTISNDVGIIAQEIESVLSDTITIDASTWNMNTSYYYSNSVAVGTGQPTMTITSGGNVGIGTISPAQFNWNVSGREWEDSFPDFARIESMCNQYPGLKIAFEKFKTVYKLVKDDYDSPKD